MRPEFAIETAGLTKIYRSRFRGREIRAVSDVSLRVQEGIKFGLLGANGAGKTTFVKMLLSAVHPTTGSARLFGLDAERPEGRRPIGYLPENHRFPTYLTGQGMLRFYGALSGLAPAELRERIPEMIEMVGLAGWERVRIKKYSKGMLQRLGLAQALLHRPRLLILDEPTDGVDPLGRRQIRDVLNRLLGTGVTIFINSHLLSEVESFCDEVAIIDKGRLALQGKVRELIAGRGYSLTARQVADKLRDLLRSLCAAMEFTGGDLRMQFASIDALNQAIDVIRQAGGLIENVQSSVTTLEDVFIRTTQRAAAVPEPAEVAS
jgi:ABC-2 type transport system ATP-binding protein